MRVALEYGRHHVELEVPHDATVVKYGHGTPVEDEAKAVRHALLNPRGCPPLIDLVVPGGSVTVVFPDHTRSMPNQTVLPPLLGLLHQAGARPEDITLLCATGTHRAPTSAELEELLGPRLLSTYPTGVHHDVGDEHVTVGQVDGVDVALDRRYVDAELRILTGFVEPHVFAGVSGGPKGVCPGLAARSTIFEAHSRARIASPHSTWLETEGNPVHDFIRAACHLCPPSFSVDVTITRTRQLTAVFAGDVWRSHEAAVALLKESAAQEVGQDFDLVVSTNSGYPLDRNLYQCIKGLGAAERLVRTSGTILMAAECMDGLPPEGGFADILRSAAEQSSHPSPGIDDPDRVGPGMDLPTGGLDHWAVQILTRITRHASVGMFSAGLSDEDLSLAGLWRVDDLQREIDLRLREEPRPRLCVLPEGPLDFVLT